MEGPLPAARVWKLLVPGYKKTLLSPSWDKSVSFCDTTQIDVNDVRSLRVPSYAPDG